MTIIIDTSAIVAVLVSEPRRAALVRATNGADMVAPGSVHWEVGYAMVNCSFSDLRDDGDRLSMSRVSASISRRMRSWLSCMKGVALPEQPDPRNSSYDWARAGRPIPK